MIQYGFCSTAWRYTPERQPVFSEHQGDEQQETEQPSLTIWQNDAAYFYFGVSTSETLSNLTCHIACEEEISYQLSCIDKTAGYMGRGMTWGEIPKGPNKEFYDILVPYKEAAELTDDFQLYCLTCRSKQETGIFSGKITLSATEIGQIGCLAFSVEVLALNYEKVDQTLFDLELWEYPFSVARYYGIQANEWFSERHQQLLRENLTVYHEAGGRTIAAAITHGPWAHQTYDTCYSLVKWQYINGQFVYDFSLFDQYVALNRSLGIDQAIKSFSILPWENKVSYFDEEDQLVTIIVEPGSLKWREIWQHFLTAYSQHLEEKGWFEQTYLSMDEAPIAVLKTVISLVHSVTNSQGAHLKLSCAINYQAFDGDLLDEFADISINMAQVGEKKDFLELVNYRQSKGWKTTIYNCVGDYPSMFVYSDPEEAQFIIWYCASLKVDGFLRWALDAWVEDPVNCLNHWFWESGDSLLIYPHGPHDNRPYLSVRYQQLMQGLSSLRKYRYLLALDGRKVSEVTTLLDQLVVPEGKVNEFGARVAKDASNRVFIHTQMQQLEQTLQAAYRAFLSE